MEKKCFFLKKKLQKVLQVTKNTVPLHPLKERGSRILSEDSYSEGLKLDK